MKVSIGSDHRGLQQRQVIAAAITALGHEVDDLGSFSEEPCDYPDIAAMVGSRVASGETETGILVCGTGIGMCIAANKVNGIRAALSCDIATTKLSRQHNNANVLCLAGNNFDELQFKGMVTAWLTTEFEGGRHQRRLDKVAALESGC
ncbi:MAG: ribose 5-phosphate isomerase B [Mariniblastus sp.]|jgi:ribose 5-phosphate isomerase B